MKRRFADQPERVSTSGNHDDYLANHLARIDQEFLSPKRLSRLLDVSQSRVREQLRDRRLPYIRIGRCVRIPKEVVCMAIEPQDTANPFDLYQREKITERAISRLSVRHGCFLRPKTVATLLDVTPTAVRNWVRQKRMHGRKMGRSVHIPVEVLVARIRSSLAGVGEFLDE